MYWPQKTASELARLEKKRSDTRLNIGVTPERMKQVRSCVVAPD